MASKRGKQPKETLDTSRVMGVFGYRGGGDKPRKQQVIKYDKQGNVLGDDGFSMTKARKTMHRIFDAWFIYIFVMVVIGFILMLMGWQQGAQFTSWDSGQSGGNQLNGVDTALLVRLEALLCVYSGVIAALINFFGFRWLYDRKSAGMVYGMFFALGAVCIGYIVFGMTVLGLPDPLSLVNICFILITMLAMGAVKAERPSLRKPKVGRKEVK